MILNKGMMPSIDQMANQYLNHKTVSDTKKTENVSFSDILTQKQDARIESGELRFSKHALLRLSNRGLSLTDEQMTRLEEGKQKASQKGINESLVLVDDLAFIVNIKNNTVVTALDSKKAEESVYTNIDGAVIA